VSLEPKQIISGKYRLERHLARGGMGAVWRARHLDLDVDVALKFPRSEPNWDESANRRFKSEARAAAAIRSPHVVQIHDFGFHEDRPFIAMELLAGEDLGTLLDRVGQLTTDEAAPLFHDAVKGLRAAHDAGLVHRDIKPSNLFLAEQGGETVLKLLDFGIAKRASGEGGDTTGNLVYGSPSYMSPEQARGKSVDARSDTWSLAAVLFRMLSGHPPFDGENSADILVRVCTEAPPLISSLVPELEAADEFFSKALATDPERRFESVTALRAAASMLLGLSGETRDSVSSSMSGGSSAKREGRESETAPLTPASGAPEKQRSLAGEETEALAVATQAPKKAFSASASDGERARPYGWVVALGLLLALALFWLRRPVEAVDSRPVEPDTLESPPSPRVGARADLDAGSAPPASPEKKGDSAQAEVSEQQKEKAEEDRMNASLSPPAAPLTRKSVVSAPKGQTTPTKPDATKPDAPEPRVPTSENPGKVLPASSEPPAGVAEIDPVFGLPVSSP